MTTLAPGKKEPRDYNRLTVCLGDQQREQLAKLAKEQDRSMSQVIRHVLGRFFKEQGEKEALEPHSS